MGFYDDEKTASEYIAMARGYDGREHILIAGTVPKEAPGNSTFLDCPVFVR